MEIMTTGTETFCIVLLLNTFFERKYTSYRFFFPLSAAFLFYLWLPLNTILATSFVTKLFISILIWLVFSQHFRKEIIFFHFASRSSSVRKIFYLVFPLSLQFIIEPFPHVFHYFINFFFIRTTAAKSKYYMI